MYSEKIEKEIRNCLNGIWKHYSFTEIVNSTSASKKYVEKILKDMEERCVVRSYIFEGEREYYLI